jgi:microcystin-dependent protein
MVLVIGGGAIVFASVPHSFTNGETLTADNLNGNFSALENRLAAVEAMIPPGTVIAYGGPSAASGGSPAIPSGWLLCDGAAVSRTQYASLFAAIAINFGGGDGIGTFNLPDLRGRTVIGAGQGMGLSARALGRTLGEENHTLTVAEMPPHQHLVPNLTQRIGGRTGVTGGYEKNDGPFSTEYTDMQGGGGAHNNMQPSAVLNYLIKL